MNWAWATSLEQLWRSPSFPMWLTIAVAAFFGLIVAITLLRAEKSVANGALAVITLLAMAVASAATIRSYGAGGQGSASVASNVKAAAPEPPPAMASLPALSCLDDLAGDAVLAACEKVLFGSPENAAAAVSYAAARLAWLVSFGDVTSANKVLTPELASLRRSIERDRFGLIGHLLLARDNCQIGACPAYAALTNHDEIAAHMEQRSYDTLIARYAPGWNMPTATAPGVVTLSGLPPSMPTGKPTTADFPTSASIPPVNIMTPEPPINAPRSPAANAQAAAPAAPKKPPAPKPPRPVQTGPVQLAPAPAGADN
ncbi:MAG: hypothetical protein H7316_17010 [Tardiphaga sp.]|uniref:hypothetical protein n=1 Tax=Tardiphaga sp. TaxID=1926292 RepID=UPI0019B27F2D|nr:hypothetical protein [Tardiphaga sp.]MBC7585446.1 hypothetical protein [Tardiphaga sp.]